LDDQFIVARWAAEGPQVMAPMTFVSAVIFDLGLTSPEHIPDLQAGHPHSAPLSLESLGVIDVDWAFVGTLQAEGDAVTALDEALKNPLFQALEVVKNEHLIVVDGSLWTSSGGPVAVMKVLDDVEAALTGAN
jgi:iron complex transport system substrate-binding protein